MFRSVHGLGRRSIPQWLAALCLLSPVTSPAQKLTLAEALALAERENPQLRVGEAAVEGARAGTVTARAYPNPGLSTQTGRQTVLLPGNVPGFVQVFSFSQPLELGALRPSRMALAERTVEAASAQLEARRLAVLSNVRRTFYEVLRRQAEIGILEENLRLVEDFRRRIQVRVEVGEAARLELVRADAELATARAQLNSARLRLISALAAFRAAVGADLPQTVGVEGRLDPPAPLPPLAEIEQEVLSRQPLLRLARAEVRRAEARLLYEQAQRRPQPSLRADMERYPDVPNFRFGIDLPIPLWNRREGPIAEAVAASRQAQAEESARRVELLAAVEGAYRRYQAAGEQVTAFETGVIREAEAALNAAQTAYQLGERGVLEVLDAQRLLRTVRLDYLNAQFDRQAALVDLDELRAVDPRSMYR
jgi:cobalt-zinc-cadmium efflux system outer membrane protein